MTEGIVSSWKAANLPIQSTTDVARVVAGVACNQKLNGKAFYVEGGRAWEIEDNIDRLEPQWLGEEQSKMLAKGQRVLGEVRESYRSVIWDRLTPLHRAWNGRRSRRVHAMHLDHLYMRRSIAHRNNCPSLSNRVRDMISGRFSALPRCHLQTKRPVDISRTLSWLDVSLLAAADDQDGASAAASRNPSAGIEKPRAKFHCRLLLFEATTIQILCPQAFTIASRSSHTSTSITVSASSDANQHCSSAHWAIHLHRAQAKMESPALASTAVPCLPLAVSVPRYHHNDRYSTNEI